MSTEAVKPLDRKALVAARPHFRQVGSDLYFFLSNRMSHSLSPSEGAIWKAIQDRPVAIEQLTDTAAIQSLAEAQLIEIIEPITGRKRRRILVVEPHCDDAALSIGATMWKMRNEVEFHLLTMASRSNYTSSFQLHRAFFDRSEVSRIRAAEGELFTMHLGGHYHCAGLNEATLRYDDSDWNLDFFEAHEVPVAISNNRRAESAILTEWVDRLRGFLRGQHFEEIWIPLGAGTHGDHDLARNAALEVISNHDVVIRLYEDVPYGADFQEHTDRIVKELKTAGAKLTPWSQDVTNNFKAKLSLLSIFASQFKVQAIQGGVERSAGAGSRLIERLWTLEVSPNQVPADRIWIGTPEVEEVSRKLPEFGQGSSSAKRVAIFAISASGRSSQDIETLRDLFPRAKLVVYAGPKVFAEFRPLNGTRIELHCLSGTSLSWVAAALREVTTGHRLVIAGESIAKADRLAMLWRSGRTLIVREMDHFIQALALSRTVPNMDGRKASSTTA
jgi:LmbE family N-acetylglucosaminyl deacetylase